MKRRIGMCIGVLAIILSLYIIGRESYLLEWLARRWFCLLWLPCVAGLLFGRDKFALSSLVGVLGGIPIGQVAENLKWMFYKNNENIGHTMIVGVPVYFAVVLICYAVGVMLEIKKKS